MKQSNLLVALVLFTALIGCKEELSEEIAQDAQSITSEIEKIETAYVEGAIKNETTGGGEKVETVLDAHLLEELIKELEADLDRSTSKSNSYASNSGLIGVFKDGSCGSYETLDIFMDCEDGSGSVTYINGVVGSSYVDGNDNVKLMLCVVNAADFYEVDYYNYGVLDLTSSSPGIDWIRRHFDNEDSSNRNKLYINGQANHVYYSTVYIGPNKFYKNTILQFLDFKESSAIGGPYPFPTIGINYYVLGKFGSNQGYINIDDEDSGNANWAKHYQYNNSGNLVQTNSVSSPLMTTSSNTRLFLSKAK